MSILIILVYLELNGKITLTLSKVEGRINSVDLENNNLDLLIITSPFALRAPSQPSHKATAGRLKRTDLEIMFPADSAQFK